MPVVTLTIDGGPSDGTYEIDTDGLDLAHLTAKDDVKLTFLMCQDMAVGDVISGPSPHRVERLLEGDTGKWGGHAYRLVHRDETTMRVEYIGPTHQKAQP